MHAQTVLDPGTATCRANGLVRPYAQLREADVAWERRVWRAIDLSDPANAPLRMPTGAPGCLSLMQVIRHGLRNEGGIMAYDPGPDGKDDAFRKLMARSALLRELDTLDTLPASVVGRFAIKEDWIFDRACSRMEVRIIGIAPLVEVRGPEGELRGYRPLFWLYYPECRQLFAWWTAILDGDEKRISFEELLDQRRFKGTVTRVSDMSGRAVNAAATSVDALLRSEDVRRQLEEIGFDLWHY
ncbi:MAG: gliding motility protein GldN [Flavobacteriales bacterium]|nr:gliding motility protein GldN [Flavobacteriales bacterium]